MRKFMQLNGKTATITLEHCWFGKQQFKAQDLTLICDDERLGLALHGQDVFVLREHLREFELNDDTVAFSDDKLKIFVKILRK